MDGSVIIFPLRTSHLQNVLSIVDKCDVPIEKDDGCNHMTCTNPVCRYEFWYVNNFPNVVP